MIEVNLNLLQSDELPTDTLEASDNKTSVRGSYNPMQFVLRLRGDIHRILKTLPPGTYTPATASGEQFQAFSTLLHETIHWWQHVGSNFGLISSLKFPAQAHLLHTDLKKFLNNAGAVKSIRLYNEKVKSKDPTTNYIINTWYDIEIASLVAFDPLLINKYVKNPYFECLGHSYQLMWSSSIWTLAATVDPDLRFLPNIKNWDSGFKQLAEAKEPNFYYGSPVTIAPIGTRAIFEGQARFSQLQYLYFAYGLSYDLESFGKMGLLNGIYGEAFSHFLVILDEQPPKELFHPLIGLFLLICDISMNPTDGFPFDITHYPSFLVTNDPGQRFYLLCKMVKTKHPELKSAIKHYSKQEYIDISKTLASSIACASPYESCARVNQWIEDQDSLKKLLEEEAGFTYQQTNLPVRLFFAKFLRFQQDKYKYPDLFCWPGARFVRFGENSIEPHEIQQIFSRHKALFIDAEDGDIHPTIFPGYDEIQIENTFTDFFVWNTLYDMVRKWIIEPGPFTYNYRWLSSKHSAREIKTWVTNIFSESFGHAPDDFRIL
jgi:hypothetical protein